MERLFLLIVAAGALAAPKPPQLEYRNLFKAPVHEAKKAPSPRIIGGQEASPHSFPYQAFLEVAGDSKGWYCGGSLISEYYILTAGHCGYEGKYALVTLGAHKPLERELSQIRLNTSQIIVHEDFDIDEVVNDIALMRLSEAVTFNTYIQPVNLPLSGVEAFAGQLGKVSGWGLTNGFNSKLSEVLNYIEVPIMTNAQCEEDFYIYDSNICISGDGDTGSCKGDSGGPLVVNDVQVGIVSYGIIFCLSGFPSVCTRVSTYLDWIEHNTR